MKCYMARRTLGLKPKYLWHSWHSRVACESLWVDVTVFRYPGIDTAERFFLKPMWDMVLYFGISFISLAAGLSLLISARQRQRGSLEGQGGRGSPVLKTKTQKTGLSLRFPPPPNPELVSKLYIDFSSQAVDTPNQVAEF